MKYRLLHFLFVGAILWMLSSCTSEQPTISDASGDLSGTPTATVSDNSSGIPDMERAKREDYRNTNRFIWQKPEMVIDFMGDISNKVVAEIGAGTGFFAFRVARKAKKVIAIDIDQGIINYLDSAKVMELPEIDQAKLEARLGQANDPSLQPGEADIIMVVNTYLFIRDEVGKEYLKKLLDVLPENGEILIIDFKKKKIPINVNAPFEARVPLYEVEFDLEEAGFRNIESNDKALDYQYIVSAVK